MLVNCLNCNLEFDKAQNQINRTPNHFCDRSCAATYNNKRMPKRTPQGICNDCQKPCPISRKRCKECYDNKTIDPKCMTLLEMDSYYPVKTKRMLGWKSNIIRSFCRNWNKDLIGSKCSKCGYTKHSEMCHIKAIKDFDELSTIGEINHRANIVMLCPNCHWEFDKGLLSL